jgi:hypothetical protein
MVQPGLKRKTTKAARGDPLVLFSSFVAFVNSYKYYISLHRYQKLQRNVNLLGVQIFNGTFTFSFFSVAAFVRILPTGFTKEQLTFPADEAFLRCPHSWSAFGRACRLPKLLLGPRHM